MMYGFQMFYTVWREKKISIFFWFVWILAFLLTAAMVFTNLGTGLNVSYAGTADQVTFQMKGADLVAAVEEAIESGHEITADDLGFTNGRIAEIAKVFFGTKGAVYEVYPMRAI